MRKIFFETLKLEMEKTEEIVVLTADMGYGLLDSIRREFPNRFYNVGSAEQLMIGMAAGMAMEGKIPICYSITPFLIYRPFEFIRNFMNHEKLPIKLIGGGRDKDYGHLGFTHWAEEDVDVIGQLKNIECYKPVNEETLSKLIPHIIYSKNPCYLNLVK